MTLKTDWQQLLKRLARKLLGFLVHCLPERSFLCLLTECARAYSATHKPVDGLRFLFRLGTRIHGMQGGLAAACEGGTHPKHRLTKYHDFFVKHIEQGETVLDIGCGGGFVACEVAEKTGAQLTGIDLNEKNIHTAREERSHPNIAYIHGDALHDLPNDHYDVIILSNVLEHIENRIDFLKHVHDHCTPKKWLIRVPLFDRDWRVPLMKELGVDWRLDETHRIEYTIESFEAEISRAGLRIKDVECRWGEIWSELHSVNA